MTEVYGKRKATQGKRRSVRKRDRDQATRGQREEEGRKGERGEEGDGGTLEDTGAGSCQNIPYWKSEVWGGGGGEETAGAREAGSRVKDLRNQSFNMSGKREVRGSVSTDSKNYEGHRGQESVPPPGRIRWLQGSGMESIINEVGGCGRQG